LHTEIREGLVAAYVVFIRDRTNDEAGMQEYATTARAARGDHNYTPLVFYNPCETPEGEPAGGVVILQFADIAAAKAWYESDAYQAAADIRKRSADYRVIITEGL
jgi:uncharacterized protein (DUF1330 family)